jgi:hypothetical protein
MTSQSVLAARNASEVCHHQAGPKTKAARTRKGEGERSAERRIQPCPPCKQARRVHLSAFVAERAADDVARATPLFSGALAFRRSAAALMRALRPALSSRPGFPGSPRAGYCPGARKPSAGTAPPAAAIVPQGVMPGAARERFARPRAGAASRSAIRIASGMRPSTSEIRHR